MKKKRKNPQYFKRILGLLIMVIFSYKLSVEYAIPTYKNYIEYNQQKSISQLYKDTVPSLVTIFTIDGQGSGVFITKDVILTNFHVVEEQSDFIVSVKTLDQQVVGKVIYGDPEDDIALVRIDSPLGNPVKFANSLYANIGDQVFTIGGSLGLEDTLGVGYITAKNREIELEPFIGIMQISTGIFPGNSGGGLFNMKGEFLGITFAGIEDASQLGFVIPSNYVRYVLRNFIKNLK